MRSYLDTGTRRAGEISGVKSRYTTHNPVDDLRSNLFWFKVSQNCLIWFGFSMLVGKLLEITNRGSEEGLRKQRRGSKMVSNEWG